MACAVRGERSLGAAPPTFPATWYVAQGGNDVYWRAEAPARALNAKLCVIPQEQMEKALLRPNTDTAFPWELLVDRNDPTYHEARYPDHQGAAVWVRPDPPRAVHAAQMREQGILTVSEVDDNYLSPSKFNIFQRQAGYTRRDAGMHLRALASTGRIVFSTGWLRDFYANAIRKDLGVSRSLLPEMFVCRNNIDRADWPTPIPRTGRLRVGWMGSPSHIWDVDIAWNALLHASRQGCETFMVGYDPMQPEGLAELPEGVERSPRSQAKIDQWAKIGYTHVPWQKPADYHRVALPFDIGLCPLLHNQHTDGKSDVKFVENTISGAATIAQNTVVYNRTVVHGETGLLVGSQREMLQAVDLLIRDEGLRERLVANAREYVQAERGLDQLRAEWGAAVDNDQ